MGWLEIAHLNTASNYQLKRSTDHFTSRRFPILYLLHDKHLTVTSGLDFKPGKPIKSELC